jgi:hypothetical protein
MEIRDELASSMNRQDQAPNIALAERITEAGNERAIGQLVTLLEQGDRAVQHDAIKVLDEVGERVPALIAGYAAVFLRVMKSRDNRLVWGALTALASISKSRPGAVHESIDAILAAADQGSVIARDQAMVILCALTSNKKYAASMAPRLVARLEESAENQFSMYAEKIAAVALPPPAEREFRRVLKARSARLSTPARKRRVEAVLRKLDRKHEA